MSQVRSPLLSWLHELLVHAIEEVSLRRYALIYTIAVLIFACAYDVLTPYGQGIATSDSKPFTDMSFGFGLYFSIVTVSSLGYGDLHPVGISRALACFEVLFGLAFMGIFIARITSRKLSYHVQRLYSANARAELDRVITQFEKSSLNILRCGAAVSSAYTSTPGGKPTTQEDKANAANHFAVTVRFLRSGTQNFAEYLTMECAHSAFFSLIPDQAILEIGTSMSNGLFALSQLIVGMPPEAKIDILSSPVRQTILESLTAHRDICDVVDRSAKKSEITQCYQTVREICDRVPEGYFSMPINVGASQPPDQTVPSGDEPVVPPAAVPTQSVVILGGNETGK
jgi:Ion channel